MGKSPYPQEFRDEVVALARKREISLRQIAREFGVAEPTIYEWLRKADAADCGAVPREQVASENRELKKRNRQLEMENEVLRRAAAYFSQAVLPK